MSKDHTVLGSSSTRPTERVLGWRTFQLEGLAWGDGIVAVLLIALPWLLQAGGSYSGLGTHIIIWGLAATGLNLLLGYTGALSFGHAAFFGVAAYGAGLTMKHIAPNTFLAIAVGTMAGTLAAALLGLLITRLRGIYFTMLTIAFGQFFFFVAFQWRDVTGGDDGLRGFTRQPVQVGPLSLDLLHGELSYYYFVLVFVLIALFLMRQLISSPLGRTFLALRENEARARFLGISVERYLWLSFVISAAFTSLAGALFALLINFADPAMLHWSTSGQMVMMVFLGGTRSFYGPLLGAGLYKLLEDMLSGYTENWMILLGLIFIMFVLFFPRGVAGFLGRRSRS